MLERCQRVALVCYSLPVAVVLPGAEHSAALVCWRMVLEANFHRKVVVAVVAVLEVDVVVDVAAVAVVVVVAFADVAVVVAVGVAIVVDIAFQLEDDVQFRHSTKHQTFDSPNSVWKNAHNFVMRL